MRSRTIALLFGCLALQWLPVLPPPPVAAVACLLFAALWCPAPRLAWSVAGALLAWGHAFLTLGESLPAHLEGRDLLIEGQVANMPEVEERRARFEFAVVSAEWQGEAVTVPARFRLSWYGRHPDLEAGETWRLRVRLKQPRGLMNPGGFDYEGWLFAHRIRAVGYVREDRRNHRLDAGPGRFVVERVRQALSSLLAAAAADSEAAGIIRALGVGDREGIDPLQWEVFRRTGTSHLVAISGLHIGLVAGFVFALTRRLWSLAHPWAERVPAPLVAGVLALAAAAVYAALAGFSIPTRRALIMTAVVIAAVLQRRQLVPSRALAAGLLLVLLLDPLAVLSAGFWLSFAAVAIILYGMQGRLRMRGAWWRLGRVQLVVGLGMMPATLALFQQASLVAPLANAIAVPWTGFVVVPLTLLGTLLLPVLPSAGTFFIQWAARAMETLWLVLEPLAALPYSDWLSPVFPVWAIGAAAIGVLWLLTPSGWPARWLGILWLLPLAFYRPPTPPAGEAWAAVLDVGQGLSAVVRTAHHTLVFDAGPRSGSFDAGRLALVPYLRSVGADVDTLVVSHEGEDHQGGVESLLGAFPVNRVLRGGAWRGEEVVEPCRSGQRWQWDEVSFAVLHPADTIPGNNGSCVLKVTTAHGSLLLTGDIEAGAEYSLLRAAAAELAADVLVAPHHGSKTSSTEPFIAAVRPKHVLFSTGYRNRYRFPHPTVTARYRAVGARVYETAEEGALEVRLGAQGVRVEGYRREGGGYWTYRPDAD